MFLCDKCHKKTKCKFVHLSKSYGPCEDCGKVKLCNDC